MYMIQRKIKEMMGMNMFSKVFKKRFITIDTIICGFNREYRAMNSKTLRKEYKSWKSDLTKQEVSVLRKYRFGTVLPEKRNINAYLREGSFDNKRKNDEVETLKGAISKAHIKENVATYRNISKKEYEFLKKYKVDDIVENIDFKGTHVVKGIWSNIASAYVIYLISEGCECAYINYWGAIFMHEKELLLNCGSKCKVVSIKKVFDKDCYILQIIKD